MARKVDKTDTKNIEIALTLSGGGYRASVFHIGVLSYLYHLKLDDGSRLLDHITVLSTVSGGTITGMLYLLSLGKEGTLPSQLSEFYSKIVSNNLADFLLAKVVKQKNSNKLSIIKELSKVYDAVFFDGLTLRVLYEIVQKEHIHHYAAYATDITNALPFRFQVVKEGYKDCIIGNVAKPISPKSAMKLKLADVLAASSCFPIAFEPILYPRDFKNYSENDEFAQSDMQTMLMDGGILDNQGVDYLIEANRQMVDGGDENLNGIDLAIVSDAASSSDTDTVIQNVKKKSCLSLALLKLIFCWVWYPLYFVRSKLKFFNIQQLQSVFFALFVFGAICSIGYYESIYSLICWAIFSVSFGAYFLLVCILKAKMPNKLKKSNQFFIPKNLVWQINFFQYYRIFSKRYESFSKVVSTVMMGHIRKKNIELLSTNSRWTNRFVIPCISTLKSNGSWKKDKDARDIMEGATALMAISDVASNFHSTLWFSDEDRTADIPRKILVCGQFSICYALYIWVIKHRGNQTNMPKVLGQLRNDTLRKKLSADWETFKKDPYIYSELEKIV